MYKIKSRFYFSLIDHLPVVIKIKMRINVVSVSLYIIKMLIFVLLCHFNNTAIKAQYTQGVVIVIIQHNWF